MCQPEQLPDKPNLYCNHEVSLNYMLFDFRLQSVNTSLTSQREQTSYHDVRMDALLPQKLVI